MFGAAKRSRKTEPKLIPKRKGPEESDEDSDKSMKDKDDPTQIAQDPSSAATAAPPVCSTLGVEKGLNAMNLESSDSPVPSSEMMDITPEETRPQQRSADRVTTVEN